MSHSVYMYVYTHARAHRHICTHARTHTKSDYARTHALCKSSWFVVCKSQPR